MTGLNIRPSDAAECPTVAPASGCTRAADITAQSICDLVGNVAEWIVWPDTDTHYYVFSCGGSYQDRSAAGLYSPTYSRPARLSVGFRCAC